MNAMAPGFGCAAGGMAFEDALTRILRLADVKAFFEQVVLTAAAGRVLAETFDARLTLPGFNQSATDGYAVRCADLTPGGWMPVTGRSVAGEAQGVLASGGAHRILAGVPLPVGTDAVVATETVHRDGDLIRVAAVPVIGTNVRRRGEDIRAGDELIPEGTTLDWRHISVLAAQGKSGVTVRRRPRVALMSSGRELRGLGESLSFGQMHDSNMPMLAALLSNWGAEVRPMPAVEDDAGAMRCALQTAGGTADLVLTSMDISVGGEDHLQKMDGDVAVLQVAMKPGGRLVAGRLGDAVFVGLPRNPLASLAGAVGFVRPLLSKMKGTVAPPPLRAIAAFDLSRKPGRCEFIPVHLVQKEACLWAERAGPDGSSRQAPLLRADGFACIPAGETHIRAGHPVDVTAFDARDLPPPVNRGHYEL